MPHRLTAAALFAFLTAAMVAAAELPAGIAEEARIAAEYRIVTADFRQIRRLKDLDMEIAIRGSMVSEKNGRLRWQVDAPAPSVTVIDRDSLTHFDRGTGKLAVIREESFPWLKVLRDSMNEWLNGDLTSLAKRFDITAPAPGKLRLVPKTGELRQLYRAVELAFDPQERLLRQVRIEETTGDELEIRFLNVKRDPAIPPELWRMPPEQAPE